MRSFAIRLMMLGTCAMTVVAIVATGAEASGRHIRKHHSQINRGWTNSWGSG
jgi:hypothetical protein